MNKIVGTIGILLICFLFLSSGRIAYAATLTPTARTGTPGPTETQGTPSQTFTPSATASQTPTTTLMPLPAITLIFPAATVTSTKTITPLPIPVTETPKPQDNAELLPLSPRLRVLLIFVVLLWIILAGFVILYIRQFR